MKNLDDFINHMFPPVEDKPGYVWINKHNHEIAKVDPNVCINADDCPHCDLFHFWEKEWVNPNKFKEDSDAT